MNIVIKLAIDAGLTGAVGGAEYAACSPDA